MGSIKIKMEFNNNESLKGSYSIPLFEEFVDNNISVKILFDYDEEDGSMIYKSNYKIYINEQIAVDFTWKSENGHDYKYPENIYEDAIVSFCEHMKISPVDSESIKDEFTQEQSDNPYHENGMITFDFNFTTAEVDNIKHFYIDNGTHKRIFSEDEED